MVSPTSWRIRATSPWRCRNWRPSTTCFSLGLPLREANRLLQAGGVNELYCKNRRDAIIIFALSHGYTLQKTEEELYRFGETTIG